MIESIIFWTTTIVVLGYLSKKFYFDGGTCTSKNRLDGKVVIVTGSNTGIGYETALDLTKRGAKVILACRDAKRGQEACDKIKLETNSQNVWFERLDLSSFESIREFVKRFKSNFTRLDILINNAGLTTSNRTLTKDGFELQFGTMHLGHFMLTGLLIDMLKSTGSSRIVNVSSTGHKGVDMKWDDLQTENNYSGFGVYRMCKLANCLFTIELAKRYGDAGITSVSLHPGGVRTDIAREYTSKRNWLWVLYMIFYPILYLMTKDCRQGAQTTIYCAIDDEVPNHNGKYFSDCAVAKCSPQSQDQNSAKRLWEISEKLTGVSF